MTSIELYEDLIKDHYLPDIKYQGIYHYINNISRNIEKDIKKCNISDYDQYLKMRKLKITQNRIIALKHCMILDNLSFNDVEDIKHAIKKYERDDPA